MSSPRALAALHRITWALVLLAHLVLGGLAWWLLPHGFPLLHWRTGLGIVVPFAMVATSLGIGSLLLFEPRTAARWLPAIPAFWCSLALGLILIFPETGWTAARTLVLSGLFFAILAGFACRGERALALLPALLAGAAFGLLTALCEKPAPASTRAGPGRQPRLATEPREPILADWELAPDLVVEGPAARVTWRGRRTAVSISPVLTFDRISPDGFWSIFAPFTGPASPAAATVAKDELRLWTADGVPMLAVRRDFTLPNAPTQVVQLESSTWLDRAVYSHLNSFTTVMVSGHRRLGLRFSPCANSLIAVTHADYPSGAPARFAYADAGHRFHIAQATDAEKGPFTTLAEGSLPRDATLAVDLVDMEEPEGAFARLEFLDFESQLSTALSPTAGYGVPENAIQFGLESPNLESPAHLIFTLAASGIGRGWDSVAHAGGTYRNRIILRSLERPPALTGSEPLHDLTASCTAIARDIDALKPNYPQLAAFDPGNVIAGNGECTISYAYRTHRSTRRGGWVAQVPNPDPDGVWFHIGIWDPQGPGRNSQINTQPGFSVYRLAEDNVTFLALEGAKVKPLRPELRRVLERRGMGEMVR
ncbi:MAG TPA: hypothetical protein VFQ61_00045 [Polyangiaceae bacterium]|nr:hypothetical protein [Polyangiaceae bacterium]